MRLQWARRPEEEMESVANSRGNPSLGDILRTVAVLGGALLLIWGVTRVFVVTPEEPPVPTVDYRAIAEQSQDGAAFDLVVPAELPPEWRATSARLRGGTWFVGVLTDEQRFVGLWRSELPERRAVAEEVEDSVAEGPTVIGGQTWTRWASPDDAITLSREEDGVTTVVTTDAGIDVLEAYVASLEPVR